MTRQEMWKAFFGADVDDTSLEGLLSRTSYDDLLEIDLRDGTYRAIEHVEDKYIGGIQAGEFERLYRFAADHSVHPEDAAAYRAMLAPETLRQRLAGAEVPGTLTGYFRVRGTGGQWIRTRQILVDGPLLGRPEGVVCCYVYDVHRSQYTEQTVAAVRREEVTGLPQGMDFFHPVQGRLAELTGRLIVAIEIQHYKRFCEWYGYEAGRFLLAETGELLRDAATRMKGLAGYLGQERFCLIAANDMAQIEGLYDRLHALITSVSRIDGFLPVFGVAAIEDGNGRVMDAYNHAALAADEAREGTKPFIRVYDGELSRRNDREHRIFHAFQHALEDGEIQFWLQPQCRASNRRIVGAESLARWQRPDGRWISPAEFVPILEKYGVITQLDRHIWRAVCRWLRDWIDRGGRPVPVSVNVSRIDISAMDVPEVFGALIREYGLPAGLIKLEVTESAYVADSDAVRDTVARLQAMGFMVLMDDFGSGYSSLNMLGSVNMDVIKLDAQFLQLHGNALKKGMGILESIVNMTKTLATPIIVEGVETEEQLKFLADLGCRYIQGYYFFRPMPVAQFEALLGDERRVDRRGFEFKANQELHVREFLDEHIYGDAMLNSILGPVAFYSWHGDDVDIVRYNQQFYRLVGIELEDFASRIRRIQNSMPPEDRAKLIELLESAEKHRAVGAQGVVRAFRPNGVLVSLALKVFYIGEDSQGKKFYVSAQDVSELQFISSDMPGGYYRCTLEDGFEFLFLSRNYLEMVGYTEAELRTLFDNRLINLVHPDDAALLLEQSRQAMRGRSVTFQPYRLRHKDGGYIYVADQSRVTDVYGGLCWQSVALDVTEVMRVRNQMRVLSAYMTDTVLLLRRVDAHLDYEVVIHGLGEKLGLSAAAFQDALNSGRFCEFIAGHQDIPHQVYTERFISSIAGGQKELTVCLPGREPLRLIARADRVDDNSAIEYIIVLRAG